MPRIMKVYESWRKLMKHGASVIYTAHGATFSADKLKQHIGWES
jgi:hypothetical protein